MHKEIEWFREWVTVQKIVSVKDQVLRLASGFLCCTVHDQGPAIACVDAVPSVECNRIAFNFRRVASPTWKTAECIRQIENKIFLLHLSQS